MHIRKYLGKNIEFSAHKQYITMRKILHFFSTIFSTHNFFQKKSLTRENLVIQTLPRIVYTISPSNFSNLRRKNDKTLSIQHYYITI